MNLKVKYTHFFPSLPLMPEFTVDAITKNFAGCTILENISFSIMPGEILGLIGPNGAGKTTLLECIAGLLPVQAGTLQQAGVPIAPDQRKQVLWYQPDDIFPFAQQKVAATLTFFLKGHGRRRKSLDLLINSLGLASMLNKPVQALSKGYRRRVLLAIALLNSRPLLLLDEPFDGFDLRQSLAVMDLLRQSMIGRTMILSIHQLTEAEKICDRFLLLDEGQVLGIGTLDELRTLSACDNDATLEEVFLALT